MTACGKGWIDMTELQCLMCGSKRLVITGVGWKRKAQCLECAAEFSTPEVRTSDDKSDKQENEVETKTAKCPRCGAASPIDGFWASCPEYGCGNFFYAGSPTPQVIDSPSGFERDDDRQTTAERYVDPDEKRLRFLESELKRHADTILSTMDRIDNLSDTVSRLLARIERLEFDLGNVTERLGYLDGGAFPPEDFEDFMNNLSINKAGKPE